MTVGVNVVFGAGNLAGIVEDESGTQGTYKGATVDGLFTERTVRFGNFCTGIGKQWEVEGFCFCKSLDLLGRVRANTNNLVAGTLESIEVVPEIAGFRGTARGSCFRVKVDLTCAKPRLP